MDNIQSIEEKQRSDILGHLYSKRNTVLDSEIWGPHYWFVLHSMAISYPTHPTDTIKKKYYDMIQNLPLLIPHYRIGNEFAELLDAYPVTPYLDSRESLFKWTHYIHNKINQKIGKSPMILEEAIDAYFTSYDREKKQYDKYEWTLLKRRVMTGGFILILGGTLWWLSNKQSKYIEQ